MDDERFDSVIRALGRGASRRGVLGLLAGAAGLGVSEAMAGRGRKGHKRSRRKERAQGDFSFGPACTAECPPCQRCSGNTCIADLNLNGSCCPDEGYCSNGRCVPGPCIPSRCNRFSCAGGCCDDDAICRRERDSCPNPGEVRDLQDCECYCTTSTEQPGSCNGQVDCGSSCSTLQPIEGGECFCHQFSSCGSLASCESTYDCPEGWACANSCCPGGPYCHPPCGDTARSRAGVADGQMSGNVKLLK